MKLPSVNCNSLLDHERSTFDFTSRLQFEAGLNLYRSRSDSFLRHVKWQRSKSSSKSNIVDQCDVLGIDFSLHQFQSKSSKLKSNKHGKKVNKQRKDNRIFVKKPPPKALEKPNDKEIPFITTYRLLSADTAKRLYVKDGTYRAGPYKPLGPHAFRGDDFRPDPVERLKGKPPFITIFASDPGNLELKRNSISVHIEHTGLNRLTNLKSDQGKKHCLKPFITSIKQKPKWDRSLVLPKETNVRGISDDQIRMNRVVQHHSWCSEREKVRTLDRPDTKDYKTVDWLKVTRHPKEETTILH